jgi:hypothetical protein
MSLMSLLLSEKISALSGDSRRRIEFESGFKEVVFRVSMARQGSGDFASIFSFCSVFERVGSAEVKKGGDSSSGEGGEPKARLFEFLLSLKLFARRRPSPSRSRAPEKDAHPIAQALTDPPPFERLRGSHG